MRGLVVVVACAGCGRLGFDPPSALASDATSGGDSSTFDSPASSTSKVYTLSSNGTQPARLFQVVLATGQLTEVGTIDPIFGTLTGLAYWDANTMYASSAINHIKITLSPFSAAADTSPAGDFATLERDGAVLISIREGDNHISSFQPGVTISASSIGTLPTTGQGGDLAHLSDDSWYWFPNTTKQLYKVDVAAGTAVAVGTPAIGAPFMTGLVADDADQLYAIGQNIYPISKITGQLGATITACIACPTPFALQSGDTTRAP